jgi:quinol monooxygenase YgiN
MNATFTARHTVADFATWRVAYEGAEAIRAQHGCTGHKVYRAPSDANDVYVTHDFPSVEQASAFAADPALAAAMQHGGVTSAPRIEIFESV